MKRFGWVVLLFVIFVAACSHKKILEYDKMDELKRVEEYDKKVAVKPIEPEQAPAPSPQVPEEKKTAKKSKKVKAKKKEKQKQKPKATVHEPDIEDPEGFIARRPVVDPFRVGEKLILNLSYFNIVAGQLTIEIKPFVEVNGEKSYQFEVSAQSNSFFSRIYAVDDRAVTYVNYETLTPYNLEIHLKESKQLAEARTLFDYKTHKASYWQKKVTKEHGEEEKKVDWDIKDYTQNVVSAQQYLRVFTMKVGKHLAMRVGDEGKDIIFSGEIIRKEELETALGTFRTVVIRPKLTVDGVFAPVGEILIWLTDDDRKFMVRAETKIRIGSLVAKIKEIIPGGDGKMPDSLIKPATP